MAYYRKTKVFSCSESNERQRNICDKLRTEQHFIGNQIKTIRTDQYSRNDISGNIGELQLFCDACHQKAREQHKSHRDNHNRNRGRFPK